MEHNHEHHQEPEGTLKDYLLFAAVIAFIAIASYLVLPHDYMRGFMAVFFLVFAFFKLLDLEGFATSYQGYDIIARRFPEYGYVYPFIEFALAFGYFLNIQFTNYVTLVLMIIGAIGVSQQLLRKSKIRCACLGTYIKLPLTTVSLIEDVAMGVMALVAIIK